MNWKTELHSKALIAAKNFKEAEKTLQETLRQIDRYKVYYDMGYRSLMEYAISALGLSPDIAYNHCSAAKKSQELPEVQKALSEGAISVSTIRHLAPILTKENQKEMVELASQLTQTELRREIAKRNPEMQEAPEKARYVREDRLALELRVSEELMKKLRRAQDLVSQNNRSLASLEETLEAMVEIFLEKKDPLKKAERAQKKAQPQEPKLPLGETMVVPEVGPENDRMIRKSPEMQSGNTTSFRMIRKTILPRAALPSSLKNQLLIRTNGQCTEKSPNGNRCGQKRWLHIHHIRPLSEGGTHTLENLTVLCSGHHRMVHRQMKL